MTDNSTQGWAVVDGHQRVLVRTVSDTRRAAIINWLCTEAGMMATRFAFDRQIEDAWQAKRGAADVVAVQIRPVPLQDHAEFRFTLQPMDTAPRSIAQARDLYVHEGSFAVVYGTNAKAIGWIDTHALFKDRVYRDRLRPMVAEDGSSK